MKCPYCAEEIKDEAIACRWCGRDLFLLKPILDQLTVLRKEIDELKVALPDGIDLLKKGSPCVSPPSPNYRLRAFVVLGLFAICTVTAMFGVVDSGIKESLVYALFLALALGFGIAYGFAVPVKQGATALLTGIAVGVASDVVRAFRLGGPSELVTTAYLWKRLSLVAGLALLLAGGWSIGAWISRRALVQLPRRHL